MNRPEDSPTHHPENGEGKNVWRKYVSIGAVTLALTGVAAWQYFDRSGEVEGYTPKNPVPALVDNRLDVGSWNMHNETEERVGQIAKVLRYGRLDAMALQEVSREDLGSLESRFPRWHMAYVMADAKTKPLSGGYGNVLMSRQKPENVRAESLAGTALISSAVRTVAGLGVDVAKADTSFKSTKDGRQEDRAALAMTIQAQDGEELRDVRIITSHISGLPVVHEAQREKLMDFIEANTSKNRPTVFVGDLNGGPDEIIPRFAKPGFIVPETEATTPGGKTIDYCAYYEADTLGLGKASVLQNPKTDHYPIICSWHIPLDR